MKNLKIDSEFMDSELSGDLIFNIVEDHVYIVYDNQNNLIIASDEGNGYGKVLEKLNFKSKNQLNKFINQNWKEYLHNKGFLAYINKIKF